ncbi:hypothetical protein HaLaN_28744, partial [Haematococcus lacustris]
MTRWRTDVTFCYYFLAQAIEQASAAHLRPAVHETAFASVSKKRRTGRPVVATCKAITLHAKHLRPPCAERSRRLDCTALHSREEQEGDEEQMVAEALFDLAHAFSGSHVVGSSDGMDGCGAGASRSPDSSAFTPAAGQHKRPHPSWHGAAAEPAFRAQPLPAVFAADGPSATG